MSGLENWSNAAKWQGTVPTAEMDVGIWVSSDAAYDIIGHRMLLNDGFATGNILRSNAAAGSEENGFCYSFLAHPTGVSRIGSTGRNYKPAVLRRSSFCPDQRAEPNENASALAASLQSIRTG